LGGVETVSRLHITRTTSIVTVAEFDEAVPSLAW